MYSESYLEHHGVKGMKWGVRKSRKGSSKSSSKKRKKEDVSKLSDEELQKRTKRLLLENNYMNAETQYKKLSDKRLHKGRTILIGILATAGTQVATQYVSNKLSSSVKSLDSSISSASSRASNQQRLKRMGLI